jgi:hypothetical protein
LSEASPDKDPKGLLQEDFLVVDQVTTVDGEINFGGSRLEVVGEVAAEGARRRPANRLGQRSGLPHRRFVRSMLRETQLLNKSAKNTKIRPRHIFVLGDVIETEVHSDLGMEVRRQLIRS